MPDRSRSLADYVDGLQATGRYTFRREEAIRALGVSAVALRSATRRLVAKGRIVTPRRGFVVIVPVEYRDAGAPPASWFIRDLMAFHGRPYYVGLLSAAAIHGAAHQQPQEFQVVTDRQVRPATAGRARIRFFIKRTIGRTRTTDVKTVTGTMRVSTPEATALDLVRYVRGAGYLGNVATVLSELAERIDARRLVSAAEAEPDVSCGQRLGFLLDLVGQGRRAEPLSRWIARRQPFPVRLRPDRPARRAANDPRWQVLVNEAVEADV